MSASFKVACSQQPQLRWLLSFAMSLFIGVSTVAANDSTYTKIFVGTYTGAGENDSQGIYAVDFDAQSGKLSNPRLVGETTNPSFLTLNKDHSRLYSVTETRTAAGRSGAAVIAWNVAADGTLTEIGRSPAGGDGPCYVSLSPDNTLAGIANYGGGSVSLYELNTDGSPSLTSTIKHSGSSVNPQRQGEPHAHAFQFSPDGKLAFATDLGTDELIVYDIQDAKLVRNEKLTFKVTPGHGPRHFAFSTNGKFVLVIEELTSMITVLSASDAGMKMVGDYSTLPADFTGNNSTAEILIHPNGQFVYGSNRGHDSIAVFKLDSETGKLTSLGHVKSGGETPRNFRISPDGRWLITANQNTNNLCVFRIGDDGMPVPTENQVKVSRPVCIKFSK